MPARLILMLVLLMAGGGARGLDLTPQGKPRLTIDLQDAAESYRMPVAPFADGKLPVLKAEGALRQRAWRIERPGMTTLRVIRDFRDRLKAAGYEIVLDCGTDDCGGFDFRFNTRVLSAPDMYVDLFDFRYLAARRSAPDAGLVSVLASRTGQTVYVQIIELSQGAGQGDPAPQVAPGSATTDETDRATSSATSGPAPDLSAFDDALRRNGHVILRDLDFATGSSRLGDGPHPALERLAAFLRVDQARHVTLVGHTDTVGGLDNNIALSRARAHAVRDQMVKRYGVARGQLDARGVGYLSPIASNQTEEGRRQNRRVEAVLSAIK